MRGTVAVKQIVHDCSKNRSVKRTELGGEGGVEVKLLVARHRETGEQSNWGGETQRICSGRARAFTGAGGRRRKGGRGAEGRGKKVEGEIGGPSFSFGG